MVKDLVISAVQNYDWPQLRAYAVSLNRTGFDGTKLMFVRNITSAARSNLSNLGFTLSDFACDEDNLRFVVHGRFAPVVDFLEKHHQDFRYVIWSDVRDLIFQTNPSVWLENNLSPQRLLGAKECWKIKAEGCNDKWAGQTVVPEDYMWLREQEACCGGTLAGEAEVVSAFLSQVYKIVSDSLVANDQAALNYLLWVSPFKEVVRIPKMEEGFAVMCAAFKSEEFNSYISFDQNQLTDESPIFDRQLATVYAPRTHIPFSIVHQYDRDSTWISLIEEKYLG